MPVKIKNISAREILSSGSLPTIEVRCLLTSGAEGRASVPFGVSAGRHEAHILLDNDPKRYHGSGMLHAVTSVNNILKKLLLNIDPLNQRLVDQKLIQKDGTKKKMRFGANAILGVSLAVAKASSHHLTMPLYRYLRKIFSVKLGSYQLPSPMMVMIEGGKHANKSCDIQEYLVSITKKSRTSEKVRCAIEIYLSLKEILEKKGYSTNVGLEGAFALEDAASNELPIKYIISAIKKAGYAAGRDAFISLDIAASELYKNKKYQFARESKSYNAGSLMSRYENWIKKYPVLSIEDPFDQDDWTSWKHFYQKFGKKINIVGDDLTVTNSSRLERAISEKTLHTLIIKPNQIGTVTETMDTCLLSLKNRIEMIVSHRGGGETSDTAIVDIAAAVNGSFIKVGPSRGERVEKYNRLMEIASEVE